MNYIILSTKTPTVVAIRGVVLATRMMFTKVHTLWMMRLFEFMVEKHALD